MARHQRSLRHTLAVAMIATFGVLAFGGAFAYFTATGSGSGSGSTGTVVNPGFVSTTATATLVPNRTPLTICR